MGYVALHRLQVNGAWVEPGTQIATATVDGWPTRDAYLNNGTVRYVADAQIAAFLTDYAAGNVTFAERVSSPDRHLLADQTKRGHRVR